MHQWSLTYPARCRTQSTYGFGNLGEVTLPASTGILPWLFVGGLAPAAVAVARDGTVAVFDPRPDVEKYVELARSCRA